jgi:hypothetical protein
MQTGKYQTLALGEEKIEIGKSGQKREKIKENWKNRERPREDRKKISSETGSGIWFSQQKPDLCD